MRGGEPLWVSSMRWPATPWGHAGGTKAEVPPLLSCIASNSQITKPIYPFHIAVVERVGIVRFMHVCSINSFKLLALINSDCNCKVELLTFYVTSAQNVLNLVHM